MSPEERFVQILAACTAAFAEAMIMTGIASGLPESLARLLVQDTITGSVALAAGSKSSLERLRDDVASPGGATEAALAVLTDGDALARLIGEAASRGMARPGES